MEATTVLNKELKKGSAELLVLSLIEDQPQHGYELARQIEQQTEGVLSFYPASLYPTLYRLEKRGWLVASWVEKPGHRRRRYYRLTKAGQEVLAEQRSTWLKFVEAVNRIAGVSHA
jgi:transcriptional regulator